MKTVIDCDIAPIKKVKPQDMAKYDLMALGAPIWFYRVPANVKIFANHVPRMDGKFSILFTTHGAEPLGIFWDISRSLLKKGLTIVGWGDWYGDCTHMLRSEQPYVTHGHPDKVDQEEAEAFGRSMAERAKKIAGGEKDLIPEVPAQLTGDNQQGGLWAPHKVIHNIIFGGSFPNIEGGVNVHEMPVIDVTKCHHPRGTEGMDTCPINAIDIRIAAPAVSANDTRLVGIEGATLVVKDSCYHCGGYCQRVCVNDAISFIGVKTLHAIDMTKCLYPKCTLCADECMMDAIDLTKKPPVFHNRCEGCDLCWCICPVEGALSITNLENSHFIQMSTKSMPLEIVKKYDLKDYSGQMGGTGTMPGGIQVAGAGTMPTAGQGGSGRGGDPPMMNMQTDSPWDMPPKTDSLVNFRMLIPEEEIGKDGYVVFNTHVPRVLLKKEDWPYDVKG
jgi:ferredoxin